MKIVYLVGVFPKLSETFVLNQITGLIDRGHEVEILACNNPGEKEVHSEIKHYNLLQKTHYIRFKKDLTLLDTANAKNLVSCLDADLVHAHFAARPAGIALEMCARISIPYIITSHAYDIFINPDIKDLKEKFLGAQNVITCSQFNRNYLVGLLGPELSSKITILPYGINLSKFEYIERKTSETINILFVGRLVEKKGVLDAIEAFRNVLKKHPSSKFRIVGNGALREKAQMMVDEFKINENILFLEELSQENVIREMRAADIYFLPSMTASNGDREGLPVVILEAQAMGLPVISTLHTGIPEEVVDGETAFLVPEHDTKAMADKICKLIEAPELRHRMGKAGRKLVETRFDLKRELNDLEKIMLDIVRFKKVSLDKRISTYFPQIMENLEGQICQQREQIRQQGEQIRQQGEQIRQQGGQIKHLQSIVEKIKATLLYKAYSWLRGLKKR